MTKNISKSLVLMGAILFIGKISIAQNIYFSYSDGTNGSYNLSDIRRMTFDNNFLNLDLNDGTNYQWNTNDIVSFRYNDVTGIDKVIMGLNGLDVKLFPNPNSGSFQLAYKLPKQTYIEVSIYSIEGKLVKTLCKGLQSAGEQRINATLFEMPKGVFTCRIEAEEFSVNKKLIIN
jgi:hypothetical protein